MFDVNLLLFYGLSRADVIYGSNSGNKTIERCDTMGNGIVFVSSGQNYPAGLAFDTAGNLNHGVRGVEITNEMDERVIIANNEPEPK